MMNSLKKLMDDLRSSFWFIPSLIVMFSTALAAGLVELNSVQVDQILSRWPRLFGAGADGARAMMSTIAGSMMTVVGVTFSMILVVLTLASSQYTPRILRNFMRSRITQVVMGIFAGIFAYSLIVLRTIRGGDEGAFVPSLAVFVGFVLALGGIGALMYFIHHIASSIQASSILCSVADETLAAIDSLYPKRLGDDQEPGDDGQPPVLPVGRVWRIVPAAESGYIQSADAAGLRRMARESRSIIRMEHAVGDFVVKETGLASLALEGEPDAAVIRGVRSMFVVSRHRTVEQDAAFGIRQIVDIALRALSPGVTDTTTAVSCVDYLTAVLAHVAPRQFPSPNQYENGELRVVAKGHGFEDLLAQSFDEIRNRAGGDVAIISRLLGGLQTIAGLTAEKPRRLALGDYVELVAELAERTVESPHDRMKIQAQLAAVRADIIEDRGSQP